MQEPGGDLERDTAVAGGGGSYRATLSREWELWGPSGGYLSIIALRAAGAHSRFDRPASYACHYLGVADFDGVDLDLVTLRSAKRAESIRVSMTQRGRPILEALVWTAADGPGLEHDTAVMPEVPAPEELRSWAELVPEEDNPYSRFWANLEDRPCEWRGPWRDREAGRAATRDWFRFRPRPTFDDAFLDAGRSVMIIDTMGWPAAEAAHAGIPEFVAPTIELGVRFHRPVPNEEWLLGDVESPVGADGLIGSTASVWSRSGLLVATGGQQMLSRPIG
jgi:acyl-CoA thioesterase